jgi:hypothetical protein
MLKKQEASGPTGIREFLRKHPLYVAAPMFLALMFSLFFSFRAPPPPNAYFTIDDGANYFVAPIQVPPFTYQGKAAVQCMMFTADGGATKFVGYLLRYMPEGKDKMQARLRDPNPSQGQIPQDWSEVKKPGNGPWVKGTAMFRGPIVTPGANPTYEDVVTVAGPNGAPAFPVGAN